MDNIHKVESAVVDILELKTFQLFKQCNSILSTIQQKLWIFWVYDIVYINYIVDHFYITICHDVVTMVVTLKKLYGFSYPQLYD